MDREKLMAAYGEAIIRGEIEGWIIIPGQGRIGELKRQIAQLLNQQQIAPKQEEPKDEPAK